MEGVGEGEAAEFVASLAVSTGWVDFVALDPKVSMRSCGAALKGRCRPLYSEERRKDGSVASHHTGPRETTR